MAVLTSGAVAILLLGCWYWVRKQALGPCALTPGAKDETPRTPTALVVTECEDGIEGTEPLVLRASDRIPIEPNLPVTFGTDRQSSTCVVILVAGINVTELFTVTLNADCLSLKTAVETLCNGQPVPKNGIVLRSDRPFHVRIGNREWEVMASAANEGRSTVTSLFERIQSQSKERFGAKKPNTDNKQQTEVQNA